MRIHAYWGLFFLGLIGFPLFAADLNLTKASQTGPNPLGAECERLLESDLAGHYIVTNLRTSRTSLVQLRHLGPPNAFALTTSILNLTQQGELLTENARAGWAISDDPNSDVNVLTLTPLDGGVAFEFENVGTLNQASHLSAEVVRSERGMIGNVRRPDGFILHFHSLNADVRFTRVTIDRFLSSTLSPFLKSMLATHIDSSGGQGPLDFYLVVQMRRPMSLPDACRVLNTDYACSLNPTSNSEELSYRFIVPRSLYSLLENIGFWTRQPSFDRVDALPMNLLNPSLVRDISDRLRAYVAASGSSPVETYWVDAIVPVSAAPKSSSLSSSVSTRTRASLAAPLTPPAAPKPEDLARGISSALSTALFEPQEEKPESLEK